MCGITGIYNPSAKTSASPALINKMLSQIQYRGPDECGIYIGDGISLGHVRLSILDLQTGQQPLSSPEGRYTIVFNGQIYNYIELRKNLQKAGYIFKTKSDTEVLLYAYVEYGADCLNMFNGNFAFAIWDKKKKELFIARDRVGIRPLFYTWYNDTCLFGSEIKALLEFPGLKADIDPDALRQVFTYWTTIRPKTIFKNIYELPPGCYMRINGHEKEIRQYWSLAFPSGKDGYFKGSIQDAADELNNILKEAVKLRLRADVPVAAYLSGGIDSSATTAFIKSIAPQNLQTFSIGFEDHEFDETVYQREAAKYLNTRHTGFTCTHKDIGKLFPCIVWHSEIPMLRTAPAPMYFLSKNVHDSDIKVVITGEGADEMLGGYDIFKEVVIREFWAKQPSSKIRPMLFQKLYPYLAQFEGRNKSMLKFFFGYKLEETGNPFYSHLLRWHNTSNIQHYLSDTYKGSHESDNNFDEINELLPNDFNEYDPFSKAQWLEINLFMSGYLLSTQGDRMAMGNSVEGRYPFLDHHVIEFCSTLPSSYKMNGLNEKYLLKYMMKGKLPENILKRQKQPYRAPMAGSFFSSGATEYVDDLLSENDIYKTSIFSYPKVNQLLNKMRTSSLPSELENMALSAIISTQLLYHQYILKDGYRPACKTPESCRIIKDI